MGILHFGLQSLYFIVADEEREYLVGIRQSGAWSFAGYDITVNCIEFAGILGSGEVLLKSRRARGTLSIEYTY